MHLPAPGTQYTDRAGRLSQPAALQVNGYDWIG